MTTTLEIHLNDCPIVLKFPFIDQDNQPIVVPGNATVKATFYLDNDPNSVTAPVVLTLTLSSAPANLPVGYPASGWYAATVLRSTFPSTGQQTFLYSPAANWYVEWSADNGTDFAVTVPPKANERTLVVVGP